MTDCVRDKFARYISSDRGPGSASELRDPVSKRDIQKLETENLYLICYEYQIKKF